MHNAIIGTKYRVQYDLFAIYVYPIFTNIPKYKQNMKGKYYLIILIV